MSDADNATLASATVSISGGFLAGDRPLAAATAGTTITASYDGATGVLLLSGSDTLAHYQSVLDSVTYGSSSQNPTNFGADTSRTISWVVNDGTLSSAAQTTTVAITAVECGAGSEQGGRECVVHRAGGGDDVVVRDGRERRRQRDAGVGDGLDQRRLPGGRHADGGDGGHHHHGELRRGDGCFVAERSDTLHITSRFWTA